MMMKKLLMLLGLVPFIFSSCVKRDFEPTINVTPFTFVDEFDDNRNNWQFADGPNLAYGVISNGTFKVDYNDDVHEAYYVSKGIDLNVNSDFTLYSKIGSNKNMGILFGYNGGAIGGGYGYSFTVDYNGYFALYDEGGNGSGAGITAIIPATQYNFINRNGDWNELRLEKRARRWIGYINNIQVFNVEARMMRGNGVGFVVESRTQGEADYLQADWFR
jgi:hypothetical protein